MIENKIPGGIFRVQENPNLQILARQDPCHFFFKMSGQFMQGWQNLLMRNSGRLLCFLEDFPGASTSTFVCTPLNATGTVHNEARPLQHFCNFHGKVTIINQILWHGTNGQKHNIYPHKSLKTPNKLRTKILLSSARHLEEGRGTTFFELLRRGNCISRLCPRPLGSPPLPPNTQIGWKTHKEGLKHALHRIFDHFGWSKYQKKQFWKFPFLSCRGGKTA